MNKIPEDYLPRTPITSRGESKLLQLLKMELNIDEDAKSINPSKLRYALYARKSTEDEERQVRSIEDQIADCFDLVIQPLGIRINPNTDIYKEDKSAKESGKRKEFNRLVEDIKAGKFDGLISWHYDRIARNMKEAGEIIDMVDRGILKDLKLAKANFENTPNGKMILGINFVLSKHYSDHLSESVQRGNKSMTEKGQMLNHIVHGYKIVEGERWIVRDEKNYDLIKKAFRMRIDENRSMKDIADFLNNSGYMAYRIAKGNYNYQFTTDRVSKLLKNPLYAGYHVRGKIIVDMREVDQSFEVMISEDDFIKINRGTGYISYAHRHRAKREGKKDVSAFLRQFVKCAHCGKYMGTSVTTKKNSYDVMRFRCDNKACEYQGSGPAGSVLRDYVVNFLKNHRFDIKQLYERYKKDSLVYVAESIDELKRNKKSLEMQIPAAKQRYENALDMAAQKDSQRSKPYTPEYIERLSGDVSSLQARLETIRQEIGVLGDSHMEYEEFLKLYKNAGELLRLTSGMSLADEIIKIFFSNLTVSGVPYGKTGKQKQWSVTDHCLRDPFDKLVENGQYSVWSG